LGNRIRSGKQEVGLGNSKRAAVVIILGVIIFLAGGYLTLDWYQFFTGLADPAHAEVPYVRATKVTVSFLSVVLVWLIGSHGWDRRDTQRLVRAFTVILIGDLFLVFDINTVGIAVFALSHVFFIMRHGAGLFAKAKQNGTSNKGYYIGAAVVIVAVICAAMGLLFWPILKGNALFFMLFGYALFLGISVWTAWATIRIGYFPKANAYLAGIGMTFFFLSDFTVGINFSMEPCQARLISNYLTWIFYTPGLVLPALSGWDLKKIWGAEKVG
jgi:hypothetical protein